MQEEDGTCAAMLRVFEFQSGMDQEEANRYRYIFDMGESFPLLQNSEIELTLLAILPDGNGWSGRFHRLLMSNSAILKSTVSMRQTNAGR